MPRATRTFAVSLFALSLLLPLAACGDEPKPPPTKPSETSTATDGPIEIGTETDVKPVGDLIDAGLCYVALKRGVKNPEELPELLLSLGFRGEADRVSAEATVKREMPTEPYAPLALLEQYAYAQLPDKESRKAQYRAAVEVCATAIGAIGMLGDKAAIEKLSPLLTNDTIADEMKIAAVYALGELGATDAVGVIADQLKAADGQVNSRLRINAIRAIRKLDARGEIETCAAALRTQAVPDEIAEVCGMVTLWEVKTVNRHLIPLLDYAQQESRELVAATLSAIVTTSDRSALERVVRNGQAGMELARNLLAKLGN
jgi:hypothetical protein